MAASKHPYTTRFFRAEDSTVNSKEGYCYLINVTITDDINDSAGEVCVGDTFPWVVMTYNLYSNELRLDCYYDYLDWRDGKRWKAALAKVQGL